MPGSKRDIDTQFYQLFDLNTRLDSRSISFENPTGDRGTGARAASPLGAGRKGAPARILQPGESVSLAEIRGNGTIRHIWLTTRQNPVALRGAVLRVYWDGQEHPSIEAPIGDFFGFAHGRCRPFSSAVHSVGEYASMNIWLPMPFVEGAHMNLANDTPMPLSLFYQIDYTLGDGHPDDVGRLHTAFTRQNPTSVGVDFEILPERRGKGRYVGAVIGVRPLGPDWWGEGEFKFYRDGDDELPTIAGTGTEDYVGLSWGMQETPLHYHGANYRQHNDRINTGRVSMYRWHIMDPIVWETHGRATVQQIGYRPVREIPKSIEEYQAGFFEREDDWSAAAFWYQAEPHAKFPVLPAKEFLEVN